MLWVCPAFRVDTLRNKHVAIPSLLPPPNLYSCHLLITHIQNLGQRCPLAVLYAYGAASLSHCRLLWLSALGGSLDVLPFASGMKSLLMKLEENLMLSEGDTWACLNQPVPLFLPKVGSCLCLVHVISARLWSSAASGERGLPLPPCSLCFMSFVGIGGVDSTLRSKFISRFLAFEPRFSEERLHNYGLFRI